MELTFEHIVTLAILLIAMVLFFTEKLPVSVTAMSISVLLVFLGILDGNEAFAGFSNSSVQLFMAMYVIGEGVFRSGAADQIGQRVLGFSSSARNTMLIIMVVSGIMSAFLSNTGTAAIFIPIILGICRKTKFNPAQLLMPLVIAVTLGGSLSLLGSTPNLIISSQLEAVGYEGLGLFEMTKIGLPIFIIGLLYFYIIGFRQLENIGGEAVEDFEVEEVDADPKKTRMAYLILGLIIIGMLTETWTGIDFHVVAWAGAILMVLTGVLSLDQAMDSIDFSTIFLFVGTLSLGAAMEKTGTGSIIAQLVLNIAGDNLTAIMAGVLLVCIFLTNFMSNTVSAAIMSPIAIAIASEIGADPRAILMAVLIGTASSYATPIGSPANTMVYGIGGYRFSDYTRVGLPLILINFVTAMFLLPRLFPFFP